ncbi:hypothetical protein BCR33DRAFT_169823 [Rhizoclosmatium globosum]|uniref:BZIP domain-containing protein n=1 Tax=Rhizoclosmatium globosum TaxID=329046 RepID=A0A1Y2CFF1_9FUNG|nr:hypothetical protein BCR33DRAFT_169823 [Rhizoclosmatium globosum]|eukprot:ORY45534.1 hypothetical protein BCR33DRAFT_169823 [Rhizoclosmatium globosum]
MPPKRTADADQTPLSQEEKLKEQNRAHQKLFRERRKEKMKLLEERVAELERELQLVRSTTANSNSDALNQAGPSLSLEFEVAPNQSRRTSEPFIVPTSPNDTPFSVDPATHARLMSLEAENFALKAMLAQQQQQLHLQSYLATLPPPQPSPHSTGAASSSTGNYYANPYTAVAPPPQQDQSWRDLINLEEEEDQQPEHTTPIQPPPLYKPNYHHLLSLHPLPHPSQKSYQQQTKCSSTPLYPSSPPQTAQPQTTNYSVYPPYPPAQTSSKKHAPHSQTYVSTPSPSPKQKEAPRTRRSKGSCCWI